MKNQCFLLVVFVILASAAVVESHYFKSYVQALAPNILLVNIQFDGDGDAFETLVQGNISHCNTVGIPNSCSLICTSTEAGISTQTGSKGDIVFEVYLNWKVV